MKEVLNVITAEECDNEQINRTCDKLITELCGIKKRIQAIQKMTSHHGPAIDAEMYVNKTIKYLEHQKR